MQLFKFLFPLQHMKRLASQNKRGSVLLMAFRARKAFGTFKKRAPGVPRVASTGVPDTLIETNRRAHEMRATCISVESYGASLLLPQQRPRTREY